MGNGILGFMKRRRLGNLVLSKGEHQAVYEVEPKRVHYGLMYGLVIVMLAYVRSH